MVVTDGNGTWEIFDWTEWWLITWAGVAFAMIGECRCRCAHMPCEYCLHGCYIKS